MPSPLDFIRKLFRSDDEAEDVEALRLDFKERYHHFKLLLAANTQVLRDMAQIQEALAGPAPYGINFVREKCARAVTNAYHIIQHMDRLAPGKYAALRDCHADLKEQIGARVDPPRPEPSGPLVLPLKAVDRRLVDDVGSKMANLGEVLNVLGLRVPNGFVITAAGYRCFMEHNDLEVEIDRRVQAAEVEKLDGMYALSASLQQLIIDAEIAPELEAAVIEQYHELERTLGTGVRLAMRSSATSEDIPGMASAGQYRSALNVSRENILQEYREVVASKYRLTAMSYRLQRGIRHRDVAMSVGCLAMVDASASGVIYSRNPVNPDDDSIVVNTVWGLPKSIVDGDVSTDTFVVGRGEKLRIMRRKVGIKRHKYACYPDEGISRVVLPAEQGERASITDDTALRLARWAVRLEQHYGEPQDIEWALDERGLAVILQCRPLQQVERQAPAEQPSEPSRKEPRRILMHGGVTASPGAATGEVFHIERDSDVLNFPDGGVLVAAYALPRWSALLSRAAAVVTEQGGVAGHLATVAREFGVPALLGIEGAMETLRPGQTVTVDAELRCVCDGRVEKLLERALPRPNLMDGSTVQQALAHAAELITPLNLLDPGGVEFKADKCKTLHDITRFCHEKSVAEMFSFGRDHRFSERSSKRLYDKVAMNWWVLNLDDGFREEVESKYVELSNIVSIPMLALWEGIAAVPWDGPPPIDRQGLISVMFQATQNTALTTGVRSKYAERNYFMVSKHYCSLSSRLGFHFSTVEALVSERRMENYLSFQFKGGAADFDRRRQRVEFVAEILEPRGFRVTIDHDNLIARLEQQDQVTLVRQLKLIGYLTIHTRQLDMIMSNDAVVEHYWIKIQKDIETLMEP